MSVTLEKSNSKSRVSRRLCGKFDHELLTASGLMASTKNAAAPEPASSLVDELMTTVAKKTVIETAMQPTSYPGAESPAKSASASVQLKVTNVRCSISRDLSIPHIFRAGSSLTRVSTSLAKTLKTQCCRLAWTQKLFLNSIASLNKKASHWRG